MEAVERRAESSSHISGLHGCLRFSVHAFLRLCFFAHARANSGGIICYSVHNLMVQLLNRTAILDRIGGAFLWPEESL